MNNDKKKKEEDLEETVDPEESSEQTADDLAGTTISPLDPEEFEKLQKDFDNLKSQLQRALADYQNLEKRVAEGRSELMSFVGSNLLRKLLPTLDHLGKALEGASEEDQKSGWFKGVKMAVMQFQQVLKEEGLQEVATDGIFDPLLHEAVDTGEGEDGKILSVSDKGYTLNGKVLRPAKVVVGKKIKDV